MAEPKKQSRPHESNTKAAMSKTELTPEQAGQIVKKKQTRNRPDLKNFGAEYCEPGDNSRYIRQALASVDLPPIDISDEKQVEERIRQYFEYCAGQDIKPRVSGMANWLGIHRDTLNTWQRGTARKGTHMEIVQKYMGLMEELWESYMLDGKVNTVAGIFLGKIMFGYREPTEVIVSTGQPLGEQVDAKQIEEYLDVIDAE